MAGHETPAAICYRTTSAEGHRHPSRLLDVTWEHGERPEESRGMFPNYRPGLSSISQIYATPTTPVGPWG